jgi:hypothetical protein
MSTRYTNCAAAPEFKQDFLDSGLELNFSRVARRMIQASSQTFSVFRLGSQRRYPQAARQLAKDTMLLVKGLRVIWR